MQDPNDKTPDEPSSPAPWDDEIYTEHGVEYITLYPVTPEPDDKETDNEE